MQNPLQVLKLYPEHGETLPGAMASRLLSRAKLPFLTFGDRRWTWECFTTSVDGLASGLAGLGIAAGDRVAIVERNSDSHILLLCALARLRAIMVPLNPDFGEEELAYVLGDADVCAAVAGAETLAVVRGAIKRSGSKARIIMSGDGAEDGVKSLFDLIGCQTEAGFPEARPDDTLVIIYTSGTTGFPKGVMHSHRNFVLAGEAFVQRVHLQPDDRAMVVLPFYHMNALFYSLAGVIVAGGSMVVVRKFSASSFWKTAADSGATQVNIIEAIGTILESRPRSEYRCDHRIRAVYGVRENVAATFRDVFGIEKLMGGYGMTEVPGVTCNPYGTPRRAGSMGPLGTHPDPGRRWAECRVVDDEGNELPDDEIGELWVRTPIVMQGYFRNEEQTRDAFRHGWFRTGDLVRRDSDGWFYFVSRKNDIIRRRGENIAAAELDRVVGEHPDVFESATIAVPSELGEDEILVAVVPREGKALEASAIADWCRRRLAPIKVPRFVVFLDELPHTATHKVAKAVLRNDETLRDSAVDLEPIRSGARQKEATPEPHEIAKGGFS